MMFRFFALVSLALLTSAPLTAHAQVDESPDESPNESIAALRAQDMRLARIADQMMAANADLCVQTMPLTGILLHSADQYSQPSPIWFANGILAVAGLQANSPAAQSGLLANDAIVAIEGRPISTIDTVFGSPLRDQAFFMIARQRVRDGLQLTFRRGELEREVTLDAPLGCRVLAEVLSDNDDTAQSDGRVVQISYGLARSLTDDQLAVVFAHELAHAVLQHRIRQEAAGVSRRWFGTFGRDRRLIRQIEIEADRLSPHLLANAGYDPQTVPRFWRSEAGRDVGGGILRGGIYPSSERRAELVEQEITQYLAGAAIYSAAQHLIDLRDQSFED